MSNSWGSGVAAIPIRILGFVALYRYSIRTPFKEVHPITSGLGKAGVEVTLLKVTELRETSTSLEPPFRLRTESRVNPGCVSSVLDVV